MCYRRLDSEEMVDRIYDTLAGELGDKAVFRDVDTIPPGVRFPVYIMECLRDCLVVLVFIGRDWLSVADEKGRRRLENLDDHVRLEVETALASRHTRVIPVLVRRAEMPRRKDLPDSLQPLCDCNSVTVRSAGPDYKQDVGRLTAAVGSALAAAAAARERFARVPTRDTPLSEPDWEELLTAIAEDRVVPVLGPDLMTFEVDGADWSLPRWLASQLATRLETPQPGFETPRPIETAVQLALEKGHSRVAVLFELRRILQRSTLVPSAGLLALAALPPWRLFITSALDHLLESALLRAREATPTPLRFAMSQTIDLPGPLSETPGAIIVQAAGALTGSSISVALTVADWRDFTAAWHKPDLQPRCLLGELGRRRLLFFGGGHPQGFVLFLLHLWRQFALSANAGACWVAASALHTEGEMKEFSDGEARLHRLFADISTPSFSYELTRRWSEWNRGRAAGPLVSLRSEPLLIAKNAIEPAPSGESLRKSVGAVHSENPWPGLVPFTEADQSCFFGRDQELAELLRRIESYPVTVIFGASGLGKTSLLQAGLVPRLRRAGRFPVVVRLSLHPQAPLPREQLLSAVVESQAALKRHTSASPLPSSLWEFFHGRSTEGGVDTCPGASTVLILDQFEELFTLAPSSPAAVSPAASLLRELAELCENPNAVGVGDGLGRWPRRRHRFRFRGRCRSCDSVAAGGLPSGPAPVGTGMAFTAPRTLPT